jgi:hypothetical protein
MAEAFLVYICSKSIGVVRTDGRNGNPRDFFEASDQISSTLKGSRWFGSREVQMTSPLDAVKAAVEHCISYERDCLKNGRAIREHLKLAAGATYAGPDGKLVYLGNGRTEVTHARPTHRFHSKKQKFHLLQPGGR